MFKTNISRLVAATALAVLPAITLASAFTQVQIEPVPVDPVLKVECGAETGMDYSYDDDYFAQNYPSAAAACRAALQGLRDAQVSSANVACDDEDCDPGSCVPKIRCETADCDELTFGPAVEDPVGSNSWDCTAAYDGKYGVKCTDCVN